MTKYSDKEDEFYRALGFAITQWNQIEHLIFSIFRVFMACENWHTASAVFFTVQNTKARVEITNAAAHIALSGTPPVLQEWAGIAEVLRDKAAIRNKLAHFIVVYQVSAKGDKGISTPYLQPSFLDILQDAQPTRTRKRTQKPKYNASRIIKFGEDFTKVSLNLHAFHLKLMELPHVKARLLANASRQLHPKA